LNKKTKVSYSSQSSFINQKFLKITTKQQTVEFSIDDVIKEGKDFVKGKNFEVKMGEGITYFELKLTTYRNQGMSQVMIQFKDVTTNFHYNQKLIENKLLSTINACLSHELRNPLNGIIAMNI
jgi:nitrogen-specific signal transduction histidine kinase